MQLILQEASKIRQDFDLAQKIQKQQNLKDNQITKEKKIISKKEREARKLEALESDVLKRLRDTHVRQQEAIEEIQNIFKGHAMSKKQSDIDDGCSSANIACMSDYPIVSGPKS